MNPIEETRQILERAATLLKQMPGQAQSLTRVAELQMKLSQPCVLAIAGRVKAGKSSFLNALIGMDLAKVGELETTATINRFCYGEPEDPEHPVTVVWDNGMQTHETLAFMDSLQGHDAETLKKAEGINYLEFRLKHELLREITLVDTPGTDAVVGEGGNEHEKVTQAFFNLRKKHREQTASCASDADAVIYLVGAVATHNARKFLDDFRDASADSSALNAIGVLSKVDIDMVLMERRREQADYVANSLREQLNTVIPVSAGLFMTVRDHRSELPQWQRTLKTIPPKAFDYFMRQESMYLTEREDVIRALYQGSNATPLTLRERQQLRSGLFWSIFRTIATILYHSETPEEAQQKLDDIANMDEVRTTVREQFFNRSKIIRCFRILTELRQMLDHIRRNAFYEMRQQCQLHAKWVQFVKANSSHTDSTTAGSLLTFLQRHAQTEADINALEERLRHELIIPVEDLQLNLENYDADYRSLKLLQSCRSQWTEEEYQELCQLFGLYGERTMPQGMSAYARQMYWRQKATLLADRKMRTIAEQAVNVYGEI